MTAGAEILAETNLLEAMNQWLALKKNWGAALQFALIGGGIATLAAAICGAAYWLSDSKIEEIKRLSDQRLEIRRTELAHADSNTWPLWYMREKGWKSLEVGNGLSIHTLATADPATGEEVVDAQIRQGEDTVVRARIIAFGDRYVWPYAGSSGKLEDGENDIDIETAISGTGIAQIIRENPLAREIDIIGVGLESSHGGDPADTLRQLSDDRGAALISAATRNIVIPDSEVTPSFRILGLGRAITDQPRRGSDAERKQRSALIIIIARYNRDISMTADEAIRHLVETAPLSSIDLMDYEYSCAITQRLSLPIVDDPTLQDWEVPPLTAADARRLRECNNPVTE